jgi:protein-tyrosine phosphatase
MSEVLDWQSVADPRAAVRYTVEVLQAGRVVAFPTDTGHTLAASGLVPAAVERLRESAEVLEVAVRGVADARDWVRLGGPGQRLARRLWPGPLALLCGEGVEQGLAGRLPQQVRRHLGPEGGPIRLRSPAHEALQETLRRLAGPLVLGPAADSAVGSADLVVEDGGERYQQPTTVVQIKDGGWSLLEPGGLSEEQVRQLSACLIVFVCTGNTCRSPLAEALCKKRLADRLECGVEELPGRGLVVLSAGLSAMPGGPAAAEAVTVARQYGGDLSGHRSRPLTPELAAQADFLVAMTRGHVRALEGCFPRLGAAPRLLDGSGQDIADPIGQDQAVYEECGQQIWKHLEALLVEIQP